METLRWIDLPEGGARGRGYWPSEMLERLSAPPHRLQRLQEITLHHTTLYAQDLAALSRLPGLTCLWPRDFDDDALSMLTPDRFAHLHTLRLSFKYNLDANELPPLLQAIGAQLIDLELGHCWFNTDELSAEVFSLVPSLQSLALTPMRMPSLLGLRALTQLRKLTCNAAHYCTLEAQHLLNLQHLPSLRTLTVAFRAFKDGQEDLDEQVEQARLICESPLLRHFDKFPRCINDGLLFPPMDSPDHQQHRFANAP